MGISNSSKKVLNPELDKLRAEKQRISGLIDKLKAEENELILQKQAIQSSIDNIKADIDAA